MGAIMNLLAQVTHNWSLAEIGIALLVGLGIVAIIAIVIRNLNIPIPPWVWQILGVIILVVVAVLAIKFIAGVG